MFYNNRNYNICLYIFVRTLNTVVLREATLHRQCHRRVVTKDECENHQMAIHTVQQVDWAWVWQWIVKVHAITHPNLFTKRREKIETTSYPLQGTSIPV